MNDRKQTLSRTRDPAAWSDVPSFLRRGFLVLGTGALFMATFAAMPQPPAPGDCTLAFEPIVVQAGSDGVEVRMVPSEEIEVPDAVLFQQESGLTGDLIEDRPFHVRVDASEARAGQWLVTVQRDQVATCTGTLEVLGGR
jgi:hypothetical protein